MLHRLIRWLRHEHEHEHDHDHQTCAHTNHANDHDEHAEFDAVEKRIEALEEAFRLKRESEQRR